MESILSALAMPPSQVQPSQQRLLGKVELCATQRMEASDGRLRTLREFGSRVGIESFEDFEDFIPEKDAARNGTAGRHRLSRRKWLYFVKLLIVARLPGASFAAVHRLPMNLDRSQFSGLRIKPLCNQQQLVVRRPFQAGRHPSCEIRSSLGNGGRLPWYFG